MQFDTDVKKASLARLRDEAMVLSTSALQLLTADVEGDDVPVIARPGMELR